MAHFLPRKNCLDASYDQFILQRSDFTWSPKVHYFGIFWVLNCNVLVPIIHKLIDQIKMINCSLGNLLRNLIGEYLKRWEFILFRAKDPRSSRLSLT